MSMKMLLDEFFDTSLSDAEARIFYHIGVDFTGETVFEVDRSGKYAMDSNVTAGRVRRQFHGLLDPITVRHLVQTMVSVRLWEARHSGGPGDDDPEARIEVRVRDAAGAVALWVSEVRRNETFRAVQDEILAIVKEASGGEVLEAGN